MPTEESNAGPVVEEAWELYKPHPSAATLSKLKVKLPRTSTSRLDANRDSAQGPPVGQEATTYLYLAYGSNLSAETFKGKRGIKPLSAINVHVPTLDLTFDLPGFPYNEPCFANTQYRRSQDKSSPPSRSEDYHKTRWQKGLVGVVYEVTKEDYATIIATEGGGASYKDIIVECYEIPEGTKIVDPSPESIPFKAHTLHCTLDSEDANRVSRPDPNYAQASARYLKLLTSGAEEHSLPDEYIGYLYDIRPYTITSTRQRMGQLLVMTLLVPLLMGVFALSKMFADKHGKIPTWLQNFMGMLIRLTWWSYDTVLKKAFQDGERTMKPRKEEDFESGRLLDEKAGFLD